MYIYILLSKREFKMAGYWPSSLFCVFMDRDEVEVHKEAKRELKGTVKECLDEKERISPILLITSKPMRVKCCSCVSITR